MIGLRPRHTVPRLGLLQDAALALVLAAAGVAEVWVPFASRQGHGSATWTSAMVVLTCLALAFRRSQPLAVAVLVLLVLRLVSLLEPTYVLFYGQFVAMGVATYSVARHGHGREPYLGAALAALAWVYADLRIPEMQAPSEKVFHWTVFALIWLAGFGLSRHEQRARASFQRAVDTEVAAAGQALAAVVEERTRIARDLHDIVAHSVSMMVVQAGAAQQMVGEDPAYVQEALETIRRTGTGALAEMRRTVTMLRDDEASLAPQPGVELGLPALVEDARSSGLHATLAVEGDPRALPAGLDLAAYRIVQEALSNVRRHASASRVQVLLSYAADQVRIEVSDDGVGAAELQPGHGLIGMRERAAVYGGRLETENDAGFTVRALLPVAPA